jgi:hypothetical protein
MYIITVWGNANSRGNRTAVCMKILVLWDGNLGMGAFFLSFLGCEALRYPSKSILFEITKDRVGII